jgi:hypothetical protein
VRKRRHSPDIEEPTYISSAISTSHEPRFLVEIFQGKVCAQLPCLRAPALVVTGAVRTEGQQQPSTATRSCEHGWVFDMFANAVPTCVYVHACTLPAASTKPPAFAA